MDINKLKEIFERYHQGNSNETENALVEAWYKSYQTDEHPITDEQAGQLADRLSKNVFSLTQKKYPFSRPKIWMAASIIILFGATITFLQLARTSKPILNIVITKTHEVKKILLPDGSVVWLNSSSRLTVPTTFNSEEREITINDGEAFFEVRKDPKNPFIVHTPKLEIKVLGTSFNVKAFKYLHNVSVSVKTGKVAVFNSFKSVATLVQGQQVNFNTDDSTSIISLVNVDDIQSWQKGITHLKNASFDELAFTVKHIYGASIKAGNKKVESYHYNLQLIHNQPFNSIVGLISQMHQTNFRKEGDAIVFY